MTRICTWGLLVLFFLSIQFAQAQTTLFPNEDGQDLIDLLRDEYKPASVRSYSQARDILYGDIDLRNDSLYCVYTGYRVYISPQAADASDAAFQQGINTEHTYPQSKGAEFGNPKSDMHHLFPTQLDVNSDRGSLPFAEIPDGQTDRWYRFSQELSGTPSSFIDEYSELLTNNSFEVREDHKGNVARAMFYFYTMYKSQADAADANFFPGQRATLCQWHQLDPVDLREYNRSQRIAEFQDGKPNPFTLDCTLPMRTYCQELPATMCISSDTEPIEVQGVSLHAISPNPSSGHALLLFETAQAGKVYIDLIDISGRSKRIKQEDIASGEHQLELRSLAAGFYICRLTLLSSNGLYTSEQKLVVVAN